MKSLSLFVLLTVIAGSLVMPVPAEAAGEFTPIETTLQDRSVLMRLPDGVRRVRLQVRLEDGTWKLCTIAHLEGTEGFLKLRLPDGVAKEDIEVAASWSDPFPYSYYHGQSSFSSTASNGGAGPVAGPTAFEGGVAGGDQAPDQPEPAVEESDILKWLGSTLYFFNQYRGLQVVDVADPSNPVRLATLSIAASGEQMYLLSPAPSGVQRVLLLTYDNSSGGGEVVLVRHDGADSLTEEANFPVPGYIVESRLVGTVLYVVSRHQFEEQTVDPDGVTHVIWRSGLAVSKIDFSDQENPVASSPLILTSDTYNYWGAQVQATPQALLVATKAWDSVRRQSVSTVHVIDIEDPAADPELIHQIPVEGDVPDRFSLHLKDDILTVVSQVWRGTNRQRHASVETFDLASSAGSGGGGGTGPGVPRLDHLEFAHNESITANRFVGNRLYVVTFMRIDPLFVVDLTDPQNLALLSELVIPGFSTHLEPLGENALISIGVEGSQIAVSWFDVEDPTNTSLASRVYIGAEDGWSWTEANWDDKAFGFHPDDGLLLVPYQGYDPDRGSTSGVQIIELGDEELIKRGRAVHEFRPRRARVLDTALASVSGRSLKTLDISDLDDPQLLAELALAWPADLVHRAGNFLLQLERGPGYWSPSGHAAVARLRVSPADEPDELATSLDLGPGRIAGSLVRGDCLWVAQLMNRSEDVGGTWTSTEVFSTTAIDIGDPDRPVIIGRGELETATNGYGYSFGSDYAGEFLPGGALVWYPVQQGYYFYDIGVPQPGGGIVADGGLVAGGAIYPFFPSARRVYTVDTADKSQPVILAAVDLGHANHWPEGNLRLVGSVLYYGLQSSFHVVHPDQTTKWHSAHLLGQLSLRDPANPVKQDLVKLPGTFEHAYETPTDGIVLFTSGYHYFQEEGLWQSELRLQALAFDGLNAFLIDTLTLDGTNFGARLFEDRFVVIGTNDYSVSPATSELARYVLEGDSFEALAAVPLTHGAFRLGLVDDFLIAAGSNDLSFVDFAKPTNPAPALVTASSQFFRQRPELIDVYEREFAYLPRGLFGVGVVDFEGAFSVGPPPMPLLLLASAAGFQEWHGVGVDGLPVYDASEDMPLAALAEGKDWIFASALAQLTYEDWARAMFGLGPADPVPLRTDDSDGDGDTNDWEYFAGTYPDRAGAKVRLNTRVETGPGGVRRLTVRVPVNPQATDSHTLSSQWSPDLDQWFAAQDGDFDLAPDLFIPALLFRFNPASADDLESVYARFSLVPAGE